MLALFFAWTLTASANISLCNNLRTVADFEGLPPAENYALTNFSIAYTAFAKVWRAQVKRLTDPSVPIHNAYIDQAGKFMHEATLGVLDTFNISYRKYTNKDGTGIRILPSDDNPLGRLAKRLEAMDGTRLVFAPPAYHLRDVSAAYFTKGELGLSLNVILDFNPLSNRVYSAFRLTDKELHELRHWHYDRKNSTKIVYGDATPETGKLENYGTYAEYMSFDELFTIPYDTYLKMRPLRALRGKLNDDAVFKEAVAIVTDFQTTASSLNPIVVPPAIGASKDMRTAATKSTELLAHPEAEPIVATKNQWFFSTDKMDATGMIFDRTRKGEFEVVFYTGNVWLRFYSPKPVADLKTIFDSSATVLRKRNAMRRVLERFIAPRLNMLANMAEIQANTIANLREISPKITNESLSRADRQQAIEKLLAEVDEIAKIPGFDPDLKP
jgi:hypothetical protein